MIKLNDLESLLLSSASCRGDQLIEASAHANIDPDRPAKAIKTLARKGLVAGEACQSRNGPRPAYH